MYIRLHQECKTSGVDDFRFPSHTTIYLFNSHNNLFIRPTGQAKLVYKVPYMKIKRRYGVSPYTFCGEKR